MDTIKKIGGVTENEFNDLADLGESKVINPDSHYGRVVCLGKHKGYTMYSLTDSKWGSINEVPNSIHYIKDWFEGLKEHLSPHMAAYYIYDSCLAEFGGFYILNELLKIPEDALITSEIAIDLLDIPEIDEKEKVLKWKGKSDEEIWKSLIMYYN